MTQFIDPTTAVRDGESPDLQNLTAYLCDTFPEFSGHVVVEQFPSGFSNLTYSVRVGDQEMILRRPPFGSHVKAAHDMEREYQILSCVHPVFPLAPRALAYCDDVAVIGAPFYLMERIRGTILRKNLPEGMTLSSDVVRQISESFVDQLVALHHLDFQQMGLGDLGKPVGYVQRQVEGWIQRYHQSATESIPTVDTITQWLAQNQPPEIGYVLIHNDYKLDNIVLDPVHYGRILGVLDWEMATLGDPLMDLGTTLSYWVEATDSPELQAIRTVPTTLAGSFTRKELIARYAEKTGHDVSNMTFYYCFGLFKLAVIAQQIYYRYANGSTQDGRFALLDRVVKILLQRALECMEKGL